MEWTEDYKGWPGAEQVCDWLRVKLRRVVISIVCPFPLISLPVPSSCACR